MRNKKIIVYVVFPIICLIALLAVINGLVFKIDHVEVVSNDVDAAFDRKLIECADLNGKNIFAVNERRVSKQIEDAFTDAEVVGIERRFPNSVVIYAEKKMAYAFIEMADGYLILDQDMRVLSKVTTQPSLMKIYLATDDLILNAELGTVLVTDKGTCERALDALFEAFARCGYKHADLNGLVSYVIVASNLDELTVGLSSGAVIKILGTDQMLEKVQKSLSVYVAEDYLKKPGVTLTVYVDKDGKVIVAVPEKPADRATE